MSPRLTSQSFALLAAALVLAPGALAQPASLSLPAGGLSYLQVGGNASLVLPQFTATAWVRPTGPGVNGGGTIITCGQRPGAASFGCSWWLGWTTGTGRISAMVVNQWGSAGRIVNSSGSAPLNQWSHVAMTFDGLSIRVYINGVLDAQAAFGFPSVDYPALPSVNIGRFLEGTQYTYNHFDGQIDDVTVWNRALNSSELATLILCEPAPDSPGLKLYLPFTASTLPDRSPSSLTVTPVLAPAFDANPPALGLRPLVTSGPSPVNVCPGAPATIVFQGTVAAPFTFQWRKAGVPIDTTLNPSAATASLTIASATGEDAAVYDCVINGPCGSVTTAGAALTIRASCSLADVTGLGGPTAGNCGDARLTSDDVITFLSAFFALQPLADVASLGGATMPDGNYTADDIIAFLSAFFAGCP